VRQLALPIAARALLLGVWVDQGFWDPFLTYFVRDNPLVRVSLLQGLGLAAHQIHPGGNATRIHLEAGGILIDSFPLYIFS
jgi:hypothetical protein